MASIGIDPTRGDKLTVENISFTAPVVEIPPPPTLVQRVAPVLNQFSDPLRYVGLLALFGLIYLLVLRPVKKQLVTSFQQVPDRLASQTASSGNVNPSLPTQEPLAALTQTFTPQLDLPHDSPEAQRVSALQNTLVEKISKEPAEAGRLIQDWVQQS